MLYKGEVILAIIDKEKAPIRWNIILLGFHSGEQIKIKMIQVIAKVCRGSTRYWWVNANDKEDEETTRQLITEIKRLLVSLSTKK